MYALETRHADSKDSPQSTSRSENQVNSPPQKKPHNLLIDPFVVNHIFCEPPCLIIIPIVWNNNSFAPKLQSNKINVIEFRTREQKNFIQNFKSIWRVLTLEYCKWQERSLR